MKRKAFAECGPLQDKLEELTKRQAELPTIDELRDAVSAAEAAMSQAAQKRDFAGAAVAQSKIDEAKKRLMMALAMESDEDETEQPLDSKQNIVSGCESRAQLESDIADISAQIDTAIGAKDFVRASTLQNKLQDKENLRKFFPTVDELRVEINMAKKEVEDAVANKDFAKAGALNDAVAELEKKLESEMSLEQVLNVAAADSFVTKITKVNGEEVIFVCRSELEKEIAAMSALVSKSVAERDFKKADLVQADVDNMIKLRKLLPSTTELQQQLRSKRQEMDTAISSKQFAKADELQRCVAEIEEKLKREPASAPQSLSSGRSANLSPGMPTKHAVVVPTTAQSSTKTRAKVNASNPISTKSVPPKPTAQSKARDYASDTVSVKSLPLKASAEVKVTALQSTGSSMSVPPVTSAGKRQFETPSHRSRSVAKLRPAIPLIAKTSDSILSLTKLLAAKRGNACVVIDESGGLAGIVTDTDITRRVVAMHLDPASTDVLTIMTPNPFCVAKTDSAIDALTTMVENHFRHLPVVNGEGCVVGLLDIAKCLDDAISKLERNQEKANSSAENVVKQVMSQQDANGAQSAALQALLGNLMSQAFVGQSMPTLRSVLAGKPSTVVRPDTSIRDAGLLMAESRKAALIVDEDGELVGVFTFKDMMTRAVAKELHLDHTNVSEVMTPSPDAVSPDITVLQALQIMHDQRFLTLPVCEDEGTVVGLVDVMDVIYGCGGPDGWRSIFNSAMEIQDDASDSDSVGSISAAAPKSVGKGLPQTPRLGSLDESTSFRPVSLLRPSKPIVTSTRDSILDVAKVLASKRGSASLIMNPDGNLAGILTSTDVTRRVVAMSVDIGTNITACMTPNPKYVKMSDSAMDALTMMVDNHFRHLPVVDDTGSVVGLLDIAKCLNSVISKLESVENKTDNSANVVKQVISEQGVNGSHADVLQRLLSDLMAQAFGSHTTPTLRSLLADMPRTVVRPDTSVRDASILMAERRKAALVVDESDQLVGIFGFKDNLMRVVAKDLPIETTAVSEVMTPSPLTVSPDITVLDALQTMHDYRFLTLPVIEDDGRVVGLVDVMDVIYGCGGAQGWRSIFTSMMDMTDDVSVTASLQSKNTDLASGRIRAKQDRSVSKLRPSQPHLSGTDDSILSVVQLLKSKRGSASLVVNADGSLAGILTDTDITRRVVAKFVDPVSTAVSTIMTANPTCVAMSDSATDALKTMVENHFRHLPVVDGEGSVVGLLDIAKCLDDAITKLERSQHKSSSAAEDAVKQAIIEQGGNASQAIALQALLGNLMSQAFGGRKVPTLRSLLAGKPSTVVSPDTSIRDTGLLMAENRKAALIVEDGELAGIFSFKDCMTRAVATEISLENTPISEVMTPHPDVVSPDITVLEALQIMHDQRFLNLPVCEDDGTVVGLVDVMDVIYGCGGAEGWRSIFNSAMELDDTSVATSVRSIHKPATSGSRMLQVIKAPPSTPYVSGIPPVSTLEFMDDDGHNSFTGSTIGDERGASKLMSPEDTSESLGMEYGSHMVVFKVSCPSGSTHRIRCEPTIDDLVIAIASKITIPRNRIRIEYDDDEGDTVVITSDDDVAEAFNLARKAGKKLAKLTVVERDTKSKSSATALIGGGLTAVALLGVLAFAMVRPKK